VGFEKVGLAISGFLMRNRSHTYRFAFDRSLPPGALFPQWILTFLPKNRFWGILMKSPLRLTV
jgi:hypothetical protein